MLFRELPYLERPRGAAEAGFEAVETWWPANGAGIRWADETVRLGLSVCLVNAYGGDIEAGERGFLNVPERRAEAFDAFEAAVALAQRCGAGYVNVLVGRELTTRSRRAQLETAAEMLAGLARLAERARVTILVEAINELDVPGSLVPTPEAAVELIESAGSDAVRLLYDAYHAARAGVDPLREATSLADLIGHVQYADCPGRGAPGTGELDLRALVEALDTGGYRGAIGLELDPGGPSSELLRLVPQ
jgi:hydroxypyruvate isomerase